jgi:hypothetical protein
MFIRQCQYIRRCQYQRIYSNYIRWSPKPTNIGYIYQFGPGTNEYMARPVKLCLASYIRWWRHVTDEYTWPIFVGDVVGPTNIGGTGLTSASTYIVG